MKRAFILLTLVAILSAQSPSNTDSVPQVRPPVAPFIEMVSMQPSIPVIMDGKILLEPLPEAMDPSTLPKPRDVEKQQQNLPSQSPQPQQPINPRPERNDFSRREEKPPRKQESQPMEMKDESIHNSPEWRENQPEPNRPRPEFNSKGEQKRREWEDHRQHRDHPMGPWHERDGPRHERDGPRHERDAQRHERDGPRNEREGPRHEREGPRHERNQPRDDRDEMMFERQQGYGEGDYRGGFGPIAHWVILAMLAIIAILLVKTCSRKRALRIQRRQQAPAAPAQSPRQMPVIVQPQGQAIDQTDTQMIEVQIRYHEQEILRLTQPRQIPVVGYPVGQPVYHPGVYYNAQ